MGPRKKRISYINKEPDSDKPSRAFFMLGSLVRYTAYLAPEYAEPLKVESTTPNDRSVVDTLNQPIWYEPEWRQAMRPRSLSRRAPVTVTFKRPKWADDYDPIYPTEALILTQLVAYAILPVTRDAFRPPTTIKNTIDLDYWPRASGTYGIYVLPVSLTRPYNRYVPVDAGVKARPFFPPLLPLPGSADNLRWGRPLIAFPQDYGVTPIEQPEDRLTIKVVLPQRTIALRAYVAPNYRIAPDLVPYQEWTYPGDTNEPVAPNNTLTDFDWLVDPGKYQPNLEETETEEEP
jgi:hypothetical protein